MYLLKENQCVPCVWLLVSQWVGSHSQCDIEENISQQQPKLYLHIYHFIFHGNYKIILARMLYTTIYLLCDEFINGSDDSFNYREDFWNWARASETDGRVPQFENLLDTNKYFKCITI